MSLSDELVKIDSFVERFALGCYGVEQADFTTSVVFKLAQYLLELNESKGVCEITVFETYGLINMQAKPAELLQADGRTLNNFVTRFQWEAAKFSTKLPARQIADEINKVMFLKLSVVRLKVS